MDPRRVSGIFEKKQHNQLPNKNLYKAVNELIDTEQSYVKDIDDICKVYIPCFKLLSSVSEDDVSVIFSNLEEVLDLHKDLLRDLTQANGDLCLISNAFIKRSEDLDVYSTYCSRYHRANERLFELKRQNTALSDVLTEIQISVGHSLPLSSYLHKPVQRVLKYHLILKNLMDLCDSPSIRDLVAEAYQTVTDCAQKVNNTKRLTDMDLKTRELHELILTIRESDHLGKLVREGEMTMKCGLVTTEAFLYLFENVLVVCHKPRDAFCLHSVIRCSELLVMEKCSKKELEFSVVPINTPSRHMVLTAKSLTQKLDWCIQLDKLTSRNIPTKAKKLLISASNNSTPSNNGQEEERFTAARRVAYGRKHTVPQVASPRSIAARLKKRLGFEHIGLGNKSQSTVSLPSYSGSCHDLSGTCTSTPETADLSYNDSCRSISSASSDLGSSIITEPESSVPLRLGKSHDDSSARRRKLEKQLAARNLDSSWHHLLRDRILQFSSDEETEVDARPPYRRTQSCMSLHGINQSPSNTTKSLSQLPPANQLKESKTSITRKSMMNLASVIYRAVNRKKRQSVPEISSGLSVYSPEIKTSTPPQEEKRKSKSLFYTNLKPQTKIQEPQKAKKLFKNSPLLPNKMSPVITGTPPGKTTLRVTVAPRPVSTLSVGLQNDIANSHNNNNVEETISKPKDNEDNISVLNLNLAEDFSTSLMSYLDTAFNISV